MSRLATIPLDRAHDDPERRDVPMLKWWHGCCAHVFVAPRDPDDTALDWYAHAETAATTGWRDIAGRLGETDFARFDLVALAGAARDQIRPKELFGGFWAGPQTTVNRVNEPGSYTPPEGWT